MKTQLFRVDNSLRADADLTRILDFLFDIKPEWAIQWDQNLRQAAKSLEFLPERFGLAPESKESGREIRQLVFGRRRNRYRLLYEVSGSVVTVLRVRHCAQDLLSPDDL